MAAAVRDHKRLFFGMGMGGLGTGGPGWNKGLTKKTDVAVARQATAVSGRSKTTNHKAKLADANFGKVQSTKTLERRSLSLKKAWRRARRTGGAWYTSSCKAAQKNAAARRRYLPWGQWKNIGKKNRAEARLEKFLRAKFPGEFKYVGDKQVCIGRKFPDFINVNGRKELVELFGRNVHGPEFTGHRRCDESRSRKAHFRKFGFTTAVVWSNQLGNEEILFRIISDQLARDEEAT